MIKFYSDNLIHQSIITPSTENLLFPVANLKSYFRTKVFRSTEHTCSVVFDFQESCEIDSVFLLDEVRNGFGINRIRLELNAVNAWSDPEFSIPLSMNEIHGHAFADFPSKRFRFARLVMDSGLDYCELSKLFIGKKITFENNMGINLGWSFRENDLSNIRSNRYGQKFVDIVSRQKEINFSISSMNKTELDQILEVYDTKGTTRPFFIKIGDDSMINDSSRFAGMFYLASMPTITNSSYGLYDISMNVEEAT